MLSDLHGFSERMRRRSSNLPQAQRASRSTPSWVAGTSSTAGFFDWDVCERASKSHLTERAQSSRHDLDAGRQLGHRERVYLIIIVTRRELLKFRDPVVEPGAPSGSSQSPDSTVGLTNCARLSLLSWPGFQATSPGTSPRSSDTIAGPVVLVLDHDSGHTLVRQRVGSPVLD